MFLSVDLCMFCLNFQVERQMDDTIGGEGEFIWPARTFRNWVSGKTFFTAKPV